MSTSASPRSAGRWTSTITPVEVSLCAQAMTSASGSAVGVGAVPGSELTMIGSWRNGAPAAALANFCENSPKVRCSDRERIRPAVAASQKAVDPPLPSTISYPSGSENSSARPSRTCPTTSLTGAWRWDVPMRSLRVARCSSASGRTLDGPHPNLPSPGRSSVGIVTGASVTG